MLQIAKEKLRQIESAQMRGTELPPPTKTSIGDVVADYVDHLYTVKTAKNAQRDIDYLRETFGPVCSSVELKNEKSSTEGKKKPAKKHVRPIELNYCEQITTADIASFISAKARSEKPLTKNSQAFSRDRHAPVQLVDAEQWHSHP